MVIISEKLPLALFYTSHMLLYNSDTAVYTVDYSVIAICLFL